MTVIYKICDRNDWAQATAEGRYDGSEHDRRDGFIHFSTAGQLPGTLAKHYAGQGDLLLIALDAGALGDALKWEAARGGDLFPHLYAPLPTGAALWEKPLAFGEDGGPILPPEVQS